MVSLDLAILLKECSHLLVQVLFKRKPVQFVQTPKLDDDAQEVSDLTNQPYISLHRVYTCIFAPLTPHVRHVGLAYPPDWGSICEL